jgi:AcrR family transcriptional regulator
MAALEVFAAKGYTAATNAQIARTAGVTAAALYYYFPSKAELFAAVLTERLSHLFKVVEQAGALLPTMEPALVLTMMVEAFLRVAGQPATRQLFQVILAEVPRNPELSTIWQTQAAEPLVNLLTVTFQHQMDAGKLRLMDPRLMLLLLQGPLMATVILRDLLQVGALQDLPNDAIIQAILALLLPTLLPRQE